MNQTFSSKISALILDMDGVLWRDKHSIGDLNAIFRKISYKNLKYVLATNNATKTPENYCKKLAGFGVKVDSSKVITSPMAVRELLIKQFPERGPVFIVGEDGISSILAKSGFYHQESGAKAVIAGLDRTITYEKLSKAAKLIREGVPFFGTNPDKTFPALTGLAPGAGAVLAFLEVSSGKQPIIAGKPNPYMFDLALKMLESVPGETVSVGDRLDTDILGGKNAGCHTALILSGVTIQNDIQNSGIKPDIIMPDLSSLIDILNV